MLKEAYFEFSQDQIKNFAIGNARWFALATLSHCYDHGFSPEECWIYYGNKFAPAWNWAKTTEDLAFGMIGNALSMGFELLAVSEFDGGYTVKMTGWPSDQELDQFDLTRAETDSLWQIFEPITDYLGHDYSWRRDKEIVTFTIMRR